jgi:anti-sigma factor RsiW
VNSCPDTGTLQDFLEALLPEPEMRRLDAHVAACPRCLAERARFERLFDAFEALPLEAPSFALSERVLDRVLPARRQARWAKRFGLGYAAALVASLGGAAAVAMTPAGHASLAWIASAGPARLLDSLKFMVNAASFLALRLAGGWGLVSSAGSRVSPLLRAFLTAFDQPVIQLSFALSAVSCLAVLWWLRPHADRGEREMPNVGLLGF